MDYKEKLAQAKVLFDKAKAILSDPEASAEDKGKIEAMLEEAKRLKKEALQLKEILDTGIDEILESKEEVKEVDPKQSPKEFKEWGEFLTSIWLENTGRKHDNRLVYFKDEAAKGHEGKQMVESVGASGGFLVPAEFLAQLQTIMAEDAIVRSRATIIRMRRRQVDIPVLDQTGTSAGVPHWFGGMQFYWAEEASEKTITDAEFRKVSLVAHKLIGYTRASDELLDDAAISLSDFLTGPLGFAGGVAWMEDYSFLQGTGAGQPLGVINAGATITVNRAAQNAIGFSDLADMMESFLPGGKGVWIITQSALSDIIQMVGPAGNQSYIWQPNAREGIPGSILGLPVIWSEKVPAVGTAGDVVLADWKYYLLGDRQAATVESTKFDKWRFDQTSWRVVHRVDGQPWLSAPLTYQDGATQVSPFVILGDKST